MAGSSGDIDFLDVSRAAISFADTFDPNAFEIDFNNDFNVDVADFIAFVSVFGLTATDPNFDDRMDIDGNGVVNFVDFIAFVNAFKNP